MLLNEAHYLAETQGVLVGQPLFATLWGLRDPVIRIRNIDGSVRRLVV